MNRSPDTDRPVYRFELRGRLDGGTEAEQQAALAACAENARKAIREGSLMTAALYYYGRQLFLYYEALGEPCGPEKIHGTAGTAAGALAPERRNQPLGGHVPHLLALCAPGGGRLAPSPPPPAAPRPDRAAET